MTNHNNTATLSEIRNSVKILLGLDSHRVSTVYGFGETWFIVYAVGGYWIITYVKKYSNKSVYIIKHISMFYFEVSIYN